MEKNKKMEYEEKTEYMRSHCMPQLDRLNSLNMDNELFAKVPCTNAAMRNSLKSCNTLQCLTLFRDSVIGGRWHTIDFDRHLLTLRIIHDKAISNWTDFYFQEFSSRMNNLILSREKTLKCFKSKEALKNFCIAFLFYSECSMSDGVCMIHEGLTLPGRASKCSSLLREFSANGKFQYRVTQGEHGKSSYPKFGCRKIQRCKNRTLQMREYRSMHENLEHDRMIFSNYDRQSIAFFEEDRDDGYYVTYSKGIIDEIEFSMCDRHDTSDLIKHDWNLTTDNGVSFMIGGLRLPSLMRVIPWTRRTN